LLPIIARNHPKFQGSTVQTLEFKVRFYGRDAAQGELHNVPIQVTIGDVTGTETLFASDWISVTPAIEGSDWGIAAVDVSSATLEAGISYQVSVKGAMHLSREATVALSDGLLIDYTDPTLNPDGFLWACDINQDNHVTTADIYILVEYLDSPSPLDPDPYSEVYRSDQNGDGVIDVLDYVICGNSYRAVGG
jgi:hypothetical protein